MTRVQTSTPIGVAEVGAWVPIGSPFTSLALVNVPFKDIEDNCSPELGPLLRRYYLSCESESHVYLHHLMRSDNDRHFHDHPWAFTTVLLTGDYIEHTPEGVFRRPRGSVLFRPARWLHWLELERPCWTLVVTGPREREWGFQTAEGWVSHRNYGREHCD